MSAKVSNISRSNAARSSAGRLSRNSHSSRFTVLLLGMARAMPILLLCSGCASSGFHPTGLVQLPSKEVSLSVDVIFRPLLVPVLETHGLQIVTNGTPGALYCKAHWSGITILNAEVSLWDGGKLLVKGESSNFASGTWVARDAAVQGLVTRAVVALDEELGKMERHEASTIRPATLAAPARR